MTGIALFGAGTIGRVHARNIAAHPGCQLKYVVDKDIGRAEALCRAHGGQAGADIEIALNDKTVDAVVVASSTSAHYAHLTAVIAAGKPVLCEKPIADDLADAKRCADAAAAADLVAATAFNRRYDASYLAVHDRIRAGEIGKVEMIHIVSRTQAPTPAPESVRFSGGMLREKGSHHYDLAAWLSGAEPVEIFAAGDCLVDRGPHDAFGQWGPRHVQLQPTHRLRLRGDDRGVRLGGHARGRPPAPSRCRALQARQRYRGWPARRLVRAVRPDLPGRAGRVPGGGARARCCLCQSRRWLARPGDCRGGDPLRAGEAGRPDPIERIW